MINNHFTFGAFHISHKHSCQSWNWGGIHLVKTDNTIFVAWLCPFNIAFHSTVGLEIWAIFILNFLCSFQSQTPSSNPYQMHCVLPAPHFCWLGLRVRGHFFKKRSCSCNAIWHHSTVCWTGRAAAHQQQEESGLVFSSFVCALPSCSLSLTERACIWFLALPP